MENIILWDYLIIDMFYFNIAVTAILLMLFVWFLVDNQMYEKYADIGDDGFGHALMGYGPGLRWYPLMNYPMRYTKNMSHDLRGDVLPTYVDVGPWLNSPMVG